MEEVWSDFPDFEELFEVSSYGRIWDKKRKRLRFPHVQKKNGYAYFRFWKDHVRHNYRLHILVAKTFIDNPENKPEVHHIDENKLNNRIDNLMWVTHEEHKLLHKETGTRNKKLSNKLRNHPNMSKPVEQYTKDGKFVAEYPSGEEAARKTGFSRGNISNCCSGRNGCRTVKGYIFRFKYA